METSCWRGFYTKAWETLSANFFGIRYNVLFSFIGTSIGFGQMWRVPKLTELYGVYFLLMYGFCLLTVAHAVVYAQAAMSQYTRLHLVKAYRFIPLGDGLAYSALMYSFFFYAMNIQLALFAILFTFRSFAVPFPWMACNTTDLNFVNFTCSEGSGGNCTSNCTYVAMYYWLGISGGDRGMFLEYVGKISMHIFIYSVCAWIQTYFSLYHSKKATYTLAAIITPAVYLFLILLFLFSLTQDGSWDGLHSFFDFTQYEVLYDPYTWTAAIAQAFYVMGADMTFVSSIYSRSPYTFSSHIELAKISVVLYVISFIASCYIASIKGIMKNKLQQDIAESDIEGPGWLFIAYSETLGTINSHVLSIFVFFFFMQMCISTSPILVNSLLSNLYTLFPRLRNHRYKVGLVCVILAFFTTFAMLHEKGMPFLYVIYQFVFKIVILSLISLKLLYICHFYGLGLFCEDLAFMTNRYPNRYYRYIWVFGPYVFITLSIASTIIIIMDPNKMYNTNMIVAGFFGIIALLSPVLICTPIIIYKYAKQHNCKSCILPYEKYATAGTNSGLKRHEFSRKRLIY